MQLSRYPQTYSPLPQKGSVTLLAFIVLGVVTVVGLSFNYFASNSLRQVNRMQINEKAIFVGDALLELAKHEAERRARAGEFDTEFEKVAQGQTGTGSFKSDEGDMGTFLNQLTDANQNVNFKIDLKFIPESKVSKFPLQGDFLDDRLETKGRVELTVKYTIGFDVFKNGKQEIARSSERTLSTEFEFKRVRIQPMAVRHFSLFAQDASEKGGKSENPREFLVGQSKFNNLLVNRTGEPIGNNNKWLKIDNGGGGQNFTDKNSNPFGSNLAYILMGTGGKEDKKIFLNLTAGDQGASESFLMYRGANGTSDFYRLFSYDYQLFTDNDSQVDEPFTEVKKLWGQVSKKQSDVDLTIGLPLYYLARKDYGYAEAWREHKEFGFVIGDDAKIGANSMHLFGSVDQQSFSVVFGNVFRRCLSLSGYKQYKNQKNSQGGTRSYEYQAGPIYYYRDFDHLHAHKLYMDKRNLQDYRENGSMAPIELWDQRMNWTKVNAGDPDLKAKGGWIFTSGDGLLLRMVSAVSRLVNDEKNAAKLYNATTGFSHKFNTDRGESLLALWKKLRDLPTEKLDQKGFVAPLIQAIYRSNHFGGEDKFPSLYEFDKDSKRFVFTTESLNFSAYIRELLSTFYFSSSLIKAQLEAESPSDFMRDLGLDDPHHQILWAASELYEKDILNEAAGWKSGDELHDLYMLSDYSTQTEWIKKSRVYKGGRWLDQAKNDPFLPYYTLPDPWEILLGKEKIPQPDGSKGNAAKAEEKNDFKVNLRKKVSKEQLEKYKHNLDHAKFSFKGFEAETSKGKRVEGYEALFEKYFKRVMTDPAWVLPYNHSLRFGLPEFKNQFFQAQSSNVPDREDFMGEVIPEYRDAIGYHKQGLNDYMSKQENSALGPEIQKKIIKKYKGQASKEEAYFFARELSVTNKSLEELDLKDLYKGRCVFKFKSENEFKARFGSGNNKFKVDTAICIDGELELDNAELSGSGILWVQKGISLKGNLTAENIVIVTPKLESKDLSSSSQLDVGSLIITEKPFDFFPDTINGNLVVAKFGKVMGGSSQGASLNYQSQFLKSPKVDYAISFQPFINKWDFEQK